LSDNGTFNLRVEQLQMQFAGSSATYATWRDVLLSQNSAAFL